MNNAINELIGSLVTNWGTTLATLAAVGGLSSALVDALKAYFRPAFHRTRIRKFFNGDLPPALAHAAFGRSTFPPEFFLLRRSELISVVQDGLHTAMDFPGDYAGAIQPLLGSVDTETYELITKLEKLSGKDLNSEVHYDLRSKLKRLIDNRLTTFSKLVEVHWVGSIYAATLFVSFLIIVSATLFAIFSDRSLGSIGAIAFYWIFGAFLAPVAHDLSNALISAAKRT